MSVNPEDGIVAKFGGDAIQPEKIRGVLEIASAEERTIITASAPFGVTDELIKYIDSNDIHALDKVFEIFGDTAKATEVPTAMQIADTAIAELRGLSPVNRQRILAIGEQFSGRLIAEALGELYVEPLQIGNGNTMEIDKKSTAHNLQIALGMSRKIVAAAFFGYTPDGNVITLGRNMSDTSGAIFTSLSGSKKYENWKKYDGVYEADPSVVSDAEKLSDITYVESRETGGKFLHRNAVEWLEKRGIVTHIRGTTNPGQDGTYIRDSREIDPNELVRIIASAPDMRYFKIHETGMNDKHGVIDKISGFFDAHGLSIDHLPSGIDSVALVIKNEQFHPKSGIVDLQEFMSELRKFISPKADMSTKHVAVVYLVGHGTEHNGHLAKVEHRRSGALIEANIPLLGSESQPESAMSLMMVPADRAKDAVRALHGAFFHKVASVA